jgi:tetratricopeptide (TPR) repeat protein
MKKRGFLIATIIMCLIGSADKHQDTKTLCMAWYNHGLKNMDNPESDFQNAIIADPKFAPSYYWLASYYCKAKRKEESIECFKKYLQVVDKNDPIEKDRIKTARFFIKEMRAGNIDYDLIVEKSMSEE